MDGEWRRLKSDGTGILTSKIKRGLMAEGQGLGWFGLLVLGTRGHVSVDNCNWPEQPAVMQWNMKVFVH